MHRTIFLGTALLLAACSNATSDSSAETQPPVQLIEASVSDDTMKMASDEAMLDDTMKMAGDEAMLAVRTKAVLLYADWCGSCKILDPKIKAVQAMGPMDGLEFVTLDYTDRDETEFYAAAEAAGVATAVRDTLDGTIKTGWLLLVDMDDATVLSKVTKEDDVAQIVAKIEQALATS